MKILPQLWTDTGLIIRVRLEVNTGAKNMRILCLLLTYISFLSVHSVCQAGHEHKPDEVVTLDAQFCFDQLEEKARELTKAQVPDPIERDNDYSPFDEASYFLYIVLNKDSYLTKRELPSYKDRLNISKTNELLIEEFENEEVKSCDEVSETVTAIIWTEFLNTVIAFRIIERTSDGMFMLP